MGDSTLNIKNSVSNIGTSISNTAKKTATTIKNVALETKDSICNKIDEYKAERHKKRMELYTSKIEKFNDTKIGEFIKALGPNCIDAPKQDIYFVRKLFPIPNNQYIFWKNINDDKKKCGIVVTDAGIFIKYKKGKQYELDIFTWYTFDFDFFLNKENCTSLYTFDEPFISHFVFCCNKMNNCDMLYFNYKDDVKVEFRYYNDETLKATTVNTATSANVDSANVVAKNAAVNNTGGHGILAEEANNLIDKMLLKDAKIVGRDNKKFGPDRMVDGKYIQSKYCKTAGKSIGQGFDSNNNGMYKYINEDGTIMQIEVPKDQYEQAVKLFAKRIKEGKVPGVTDPNDAPKYVRKGHLTYEQAVKIAKAGTIESITYDVVTGTVTCAFAFGLSFIVTSFITYLQTKDKKQALIEGLKAGSYVFGVSLFEYVVLAQLARTKVFNGILKSSIKGTAFTAALTFVLFSLKDTYSLCQHKISGSQYYMNISALTGSIIGSLALGIAGAKIGATIGSKAGAVGGIIGGVVGGVGGGIGVSAANKIFLDDDGTIFVRLFNSYVCLLSYEYLFTGDEIDLLIKDLEKIDKKSMKKLIEKFISSDNQEKTIREFLEPYYDNIVENREPYILSE